MSNRGSLGTIRGGAVALALGAFLLLPAAASAAVEVADFRAQDDTAERTIFKSGGLTVRANCLSNGDINFHARTAEDDSMLAVPRQASGPNPYFEDSNFNTGEANGFSGTDDDVSGQLIFARPNGAITSLDYLAEDADGAESPHDGIFDCAFHGIGRTVKPGSKSRVKFTKTEGTEEMTFFKLGGLALRASCQPDDGDSNGESDMAVTMRTTKDDATVHANLQFDPGDDDGYHEADEFDVGDSETLVEPDGQDDQSAGQIIYSRPGGVNVTVDWMAQVTTTGDLLGTKDCAFVGTARKRIAGDDKRLNQRFLADDPDKTFTKGGLRLISNCDAGLDTLVRSRNNNAMIHFNQQGLDPPVISYAEQDDFDMGMPNELDLYDELGAPSDSLAGQIIHGRVNGKVVTVDYLAEEGAYGGLKDCAFVGTAEVAAP